MTPRATATLFTCGPPDDLQYAGLPQYYFYGAIGFLVPFFIGGGIWIVSLRSRVKENTREIQQSIEEKEILLREIHHRVKNNLSIISGLLELQKGTAEDAGTKDALQISQSRIRSMALIHDKLYQTESLSDINLDSYLRELVQAISATFVNKTNKVALNFELDNAKADSDKVVPRGLLVNELVVNAYKHAFSKTDEGELTLKLKNEYQEVTLNR